MKLPKTMKRWALQAGILLALMSAGCTLLGEGYTSVLNESRVYEHTIPLNEADYDAFLGEGTAAVSGEVVARRGDGKIVRSDAAFIYLVPATPYTREWFEQAIVQGHKISGADPRALRATRTTIVGTEGRFQFPGVPAGEYYLVCSISPERQPVRVLGVAEAKPFPGNIKAYASVTVGAGEQVKVTLTNGNP